MQHEPLSHPWERFLARRLGEAIHLLNNGVFGSPHDFLDYMEKTNASLLAEYGGVLGQDDPIAFTTLGDK